MPKSSDSDESKFLAVTKWLTDNAIDGVPPLSSADCLAKEYLLDCSYANHDLRCEALIRWEVSKNFTTGFLTGFGGVLFLPVSVPSALGAAWIIQARMAGAIARIYGHNLHEDRVRTLVLLSLVGDAAKEAVKRAGIEIGRKTLEQAIMRIPGRALIEINKRVGYRLLTKAGERGVINLIKAVPVAGGVVGGTIDATACYAVGRTAMKIFRPASETDGPLVAQDRQGETVSDGTADGS